MKQLVFAIALSLSCGLVAPISFAAPKPVAVGTKVNNFTLKDFRGKAWSLSDFDKSRILVVAFLGTECPLVKLYGPRLAELEKQFKGKGVAFVGINANVQDSLTEIAAFARRSNIEFPILKDLDNKVADQFGAERTPEVFVLDDKRVVRYHGRIDDQYGVGYVRDNAKRHDLKIALEELLAGKEISRAETKVTGCIIGRVLEVRKDSAVTYSNQIARILQKNCVSCHRQGDIAPFALTKYEEVSGWAEMMAEVVEEGRMPPWHANPKYGHFANARGLTAEEKKLIYQWVKNGAPRGNPDDLPKPLTFVKGWQLPREPDFVTPIQKTPFKVPAQGAVRYQFFRVQTDFKEDKWVQGAQIIPGNRAVVHHVLAWAVPRSGRREALQEIGEGGGGFLVGYVPGQRAYVFPKGMAKRVPAASELIFQVHYTPIGKEQLDQSRIGLIFADAKDIQYEVKTRNALKRGLRIPPEDANFRVEASTRSGLPQTQLLAFMPHMHLRGKSFRFEAHYPDGQKEILLDVPNYDFNWQTRYDVAKPLQLPKGTKIHCVALFDNSEDNLNNPNPKATVRWGPQTWDEMMIGYFDVAVPVGRKVAGAKKERPLTEAERKKIDTRVAQVFLLLDKNRDGKIVRKEVPANISAQFGLFDQNNDGEITREELFEGFRGLISRD